MGPAMDPGYRAQHIARRGPNQCDACPEFPTTRPATKAFVRKPAGSPARRLRGKIATTIDAMGTTTDITLEIARPADAARLAALSRATIEIGLEPAWTESRVRRVMADRETVVLLARTRTVGGVAPPGLAGFAIMGFGDSSAHLNLFAVAPDFQRRGVGRRMLRWLECTARVAGTFTVNLEVRARSLDAQSFYLDCGYLPGVRIPGYYQGVEDAIRMSRDLRRASTAM